MEVAVLQMAPPEKSSPVRDDERMTIREAAVMCRVDYDTMLRWVRNGAIKFHVVGPFKRKRVYRRDVEKLIGPDM